MAKISNTFKIKTGDNTYEDVKISYIGPNNTTMEGIGTSATGKGAHAEGHDTIAVGSYAHAEGGFISSDDTRDIDLNQYDGIAISDPATTIYTIKAPRAEGHHSHAEGTGTFAYGVRSHAEGYQTTALGFQSHAEGYQTTALGLQSHAEGKETTAAGGSAHAEGRETVALGDRSHAEGYGTIAKGISQHVQGKYNIGDTLNAFILGNGTGPEDENRSNAVTIDWNGNGWFKGNVYVGGASKSEGKKLISLDEAYPINSIYVTSEYKKPSFPGTWELVDKSLARVYYSQTGTGTGDEDPLVFSNPDDSIQAAVPNSDTNSLISAVVDGHETILTFANVKLTDNNPWTGNAADGATSKIIGYLNLDKLGVNRFSTMNYWVGIAGLDNGLLNGTVGYLSLNTEDKPAGINANVVPITINNYVKDINSTSTSNFGVDLSKAGIHFSIKLITNPSELKASNCNKFYWKRTA